ncbi:putative glycerophosphoryl diester phosphodiesterase 1 [Mariniflexile rhizosphaerae]|uniref:glycerophosphodiester phosphodiesterase n=1 Tax=unclassified Mariniflexile TaxID=2643887 RepID=UPI000CB59FC4|nr:glycerophosphodiester phosphodiesterase family protein [Mariniflexile sp. TRM1-10]AXP80395.1 putative glycerophosphoryl diester phosphodiesterase 1 [Mariniflexile sp. TRM1-10]PLB20586.1 MAG: Glycerophosphoryl diester phosphodiesterase [Flavobacteriaceae bacterium FS1-H7996/R]
MINKSILFFAKLIICSCQTDDIITQDGLFPADFSKQNPIYYTKVIAHRGGADLAPENTMAAFQKAIDIKADYIEFDLHKTKDDSLVVIHDSSVDRTSSFGEKGAISQMTYEELSLIKVGCPDKFGQNYINEKIPTLRDVFKLSKGKIEVYLEMKVGNIENKVLTVIEKMGVSDEVIVSSFNFTSLMKIRLLNADIKIIYIVSKVDKKYIDEAKTINSFGIAIPNDFTLIKEFIATATEQGLKTHVYTVNNIEEIKRLMDLGVYAVMTDIPDRALEIKDGKILTNKYK